MKIKKSKKVVSLLLAVFMLLSMFPVTVFAAEVTKVYTDAIECVNGPVEGVKLKLVDYFDPSIVVDTTTTDKNGTFSFNIKFEEYMGFDGLIQIDDPAYLPADYSVYNGNGNLDSGEPRLGYPVTYMPGGTESGKQEVDLKAVVGSIAFTKKDADSNFVVPNATYALVKAGDPVEKSISVHTTDKNGQFKIDNLHYGDYELIEISAPQGYFINEQNVEFSIRNDGELLTLIHTDVIKCSVTLIKLDSKTNIPLEGVKFALHKIGMGDVDLNGTVTNGDLNLLRS